MTQVIPPTLDVTIKLTLHSVIHTFCKKRNQNETKAELNISSSLGISTGLRVYGVASYAYLNGVVHITFIFQNPLPTKISSFGQATQDLLDLKQS